MFTGVFPWASVVERMAHRKGAEDAEISIFCFAERQPQSKKGVNPYRNNLNPWPKGQSPFIVCLSQANYKDLPLWVLCASAVQHLCP
jgi:hypothetical protein